MDDFARFLSTFEQKAGWKLTEVRAFCQFIDYPHFQAKKRG